MEIVGKIVADNVSDYNDVPQFETTDLNQSAAASYEGGDWRLPNLNVRSRLRR